MRKVFLSFSLLSLSPFVSAFADESLFLTPESFTEFRGIDRQSIEEVKTTLEKLSREELLNDILLSKIVIRNLLMIIENTSVSNFSKNSPDFAGNLNRLTETEQLQISNLESQLERNKLRAQFRKKRYEEFRNQFSADVHKILQQ
jgi:hypothetical protein